jgi:hypothetical protein
LLCFLTSSKVRGFFTLNFLNFINISIHIPILMPPTIQCIIEGTFMTIITWNFVYNFVILVLFVNCIKFPFPSNWSPQESKDGSQHLSMKFQPCVFQIIFIGLCVCPLLDSRYHQRGLSN